MIHLLSSPALILLFTLWFSVPGSEVVNFLTADDCAVLGVVQAGDTNIIMVTPSANVWEWDVVCGETLLIAMTPSGVMHDYFVADLNGNHSAGYADDDHFVYHMIHPEERRSQICHYRTTTRSFTVYPVPAHFIGAITVWDNRIYYSTEHFEDNIHFIDLETGEAHFLQGSGDTATNSDFWVVDGELIVTYGGDYGHPYRLERDGLHRAPGVEVSDATRQGIWLRDILATDRDLVEHYELLLGIR